MQILVLNPSFETIAVVDEYESLLWTDRYNEAGDFELFISAQSPYLPFLQQDNYCMIENSESVMIIEDIEIRSDAESGDKAIIRGRSLEAILDRRIVWNQTTFADRSLRYIIEKLLTKNVIKTGSQNAGLNNRDIPGFELGPDFTSKDNPIIDDSTNLDISQIDVQYTGDNLYTVITDLCNAFTVGYKITLNSSNHFIFSLYTGVDRTYDQTDHPYVIFSSQFDNIINSDYIESKKPYKNVTLVAGEGEGKDRKTETITNESSTPKWLARRELFTDARDLSSSYTDEEGQSQTMSAAKYTRLLKQRGREKLTENSIVKTFDGQVESSILFKYGRDYFMGDVIQMENDYGIAGKARITEYIRSDDKNGLLMYPTFTAIRE